jgi:FKBP-type peptidyl-prolyl cis-trans isomerase SlyD
MSESVSENKLVSIAYTIRDRRGEIVEHSDLPISYVHGLSVSPLFPQIESALEGLHEGESAEVSLTCDQAFGPHDPGLTFTDDLENTPEELRFVGAELDAENDKGEVMHFRVIRISDGRITIDGNHPLAGQDITFIVRVTEVRDATPQDITAHAEQHIH